MKGSLDVFQLMLCTIHCEMSRLHVVVHILHYSALKRSLWLRKSLPPCEIISAVSLLFPGICKNDLREIIIIRRQMIDG